MQMAAAATNENPDGGLQYFFKMHIKKTHTHIVTLQKE